MFKFSVIVPIYNVEKYLNLSVESVIDQSYNNIELILVNDGSSDNSLEICQYYKELDQRILIIDKPNGGLSSARNAGLQIATGDYIVFLDGDDWLDEGFFEDLYDTISKNATDLVLIKVKTYYEETNKFNVLKYSLPTKHVTYSGVSAFTHLYDQNDFWGAAWQFVVKRQYLIQEGIEFLCGIYHEDERYTPELLVKAKSISIADKSHYIYRFGRVGSIVNSINLKKEYDKIFIIKDLMKLARLEFDSSIETKLILSRCTQLYIGIIQSSYKYYLLNRENFMGLLSELEENKEVLDFNVKFKYKILKLGINIFGIRIVGKLLNYKK